MSAPRLLHLGLTPAEWLQVHGKAPARLQEALVDDHMLLSEVVAPALDVLDLLDWHTAADPAAFTPSDKEIIERFRAAVLALKVGR